MINKDVRKSLARIKGNKNPIWIWNDSGMREKIDECAHCSLSNLWRLLEISTSDLGNDVGRQKTL